MSEKVLLVDDEQDFVETLAERMRARGADVSTATSAKDALKKVAEESFDTIVLDLVMPEMDGFEFLRLIKKKKPEMQIIVLTGHASVDKCIEAMSLGALTFMEKPADLEALTEKIQEAKARKVILVEKQVAEKWKS